HVDQPDLGAVGERELRVPDVDRHAPLALLGEAVGPRARQALDERRLPVVDVTGGADDHAADGDGGGAHGGGVSRRWLRVAWAKARGASKRRLLRRGPNRTPAPTPRPASPTVSREARNGPHLPPPRSRTRS